MNTESAIQGGVAGATTLTILHEIVRKLSPDAPRMDQLGMEALSKLFKKLNLDVPDKEQLYLLSSATDVASNGLFYALAGAGNRDNVLLRGLALGLLAGIGAVVLPGQVGLDERASNRTPTTKLLTVAWYVIGGVVAAAVTQELDRRRNKRDR